jgi:hypothetical protein
MAELERCAGSQFDPELVPAFGELARDELDRDRAPAQGRSALAARPFIELLTKRR